MFGLRRAGYQWGPVNVLCDRLVRLLVLEAHPDGLPAHAAGIVDEDIQLAAADGGDFLCSTLSGGESVRLTRGQQVGRMERTSRDAWSTTSASKTCTFLRFSMAAAR